jgi:hypothetical protein
MLAGWLVTSSPLSRTRATRVGVAGAAVIGVAFGMARFAFGLTLPDVLAGLGLPDAVLGLIAGGTFACFLLGVLLAAPVEDDHPTRPRLLRRSLLPVPIYAVAYFAATTIYFTYASDAARDGGLGAAAGPTLFIVIGISGLCALVSGRSPHECGNDRGRGRLCDRSRGRAGAARSREPVARRGRGVLDGLRAGIHGGAAVLAIWTAELVPERATAGFTLALVVGAVASVAVPVVVGGVVGSLGLPALLLATAGAGSVVGVGLLMSSVRSLRSPGERTAPIVPTRPVGAAVRRRWDAPLPLHQQQAGVQPVSAQQAATSWAWASGSAMVPTGPSTPYVRESSVTV